MIYLFATLSQAVVLVYTVAMDLSFSSLGVASLALAAGGASLVFRRSGILALSMLLTLGLYLTNVLPGSGRIRILESIAIGSALFVNFEISRDLILVRARRVDLSSYRKRFGSIARIAALAAVVAIVVITIAVNVYHHLPSTVQFSIPVFALLIIGLAAYVLAGTSNRN